MKYLRNTLLMTLIAALIMPSPSVLAVANAGAEAASGGDTSQTTETPANDILPSSPNSAATALSSQPEPNPAGEQPTAKPVAQPNPPAAEPAHPISQPAPITDEALEKTAPLLISKVSPDKKYIELYNPTDSNVKLAGWKIEHYKADVKTGGKEFKNEVILANGFLVISNDPTLTKAVKFDKVPNMIQGEGSVVLSRADGSTADVVGWG